jgi:protein-tyrosine phosphatase
MTIGLLFVCTGNICRSPSAEGVMRDLVRREGWNEAVQIDSAGTWAGHVGEQPSKQACVSAVRRGYDLSDLRAREVSADDLARFHFVLAMDRSHLQHLRTLAAPRQLDRLHLLMSFAPQLGLQEVPDPWYGGPDDYEHALDLIEAGCRGMIEHLRARHFSA